MLISVVICTHNRADLLDQALESLSAQKPPLLFEILVVDNNSTDTTKEVVENQQTLLMNLRYCFEPNIGIPYARNHGWRAASGDWIAFIDDDCHVSPDWLTIAGVILNEKNPDILSGPIIPYYLENPPKWYQDEYGSSELRPKATWLKASEAMPAGNLFIRRDLLQKLDGFSPKMKLAEETELQRRAQRKFPELSIFYEPNLIVHHVVRPEKYRLRWQVKARFVAGRYNFLADCADVHTIELRHVLGVIVLPFVIGLEASLGVIIRSRKIYPFWQNYYYERVFSWIAKWAQQLERFRQILIGRWGTN